MMKVEFRKLNDDLEEGDCAVRLYRTADKEIFTSKESAYQYLFKEKVIELELLSLSKLEVAKYNKTPPGDPQ